MTPGSFLKTADPEVAADWMERVAWLETLRKHRRIGTAYQELFPEAPEEGGDWAGGLAIGNGGDCGIRLQENGLTLADAARMLAGTVEAGRWDALGRLENLMERKLRSWGLKSRSRVLAGGVTMPDGITGIVLAGVTEMPPLVERALLAWDGPVTVLIGAPEHEAEAFSPIGKPLAMLDGPHDAVAGGRRRDPCAWWRTPGSRRPRPGALSRNHKLPRTKSRSASADTETGDELARVFTSGGWTAFHPAAYPLTTGLDALDEGLVRMAGRSQTRRAGGPARPAGNRQLWSAAARAEKAERLSRLRNDWMVIRPDDLRHRMATAVFRSDAQREAAEDVLKATGNAGTMARGHAPARGFHRNHGATAGTAGNASVRRPERGRCHRPAG